VRLKDHSEIGPVHIENGSKVPGYMAKEGCGSIWCCLHLKENIAISGSDDTTFRVWDIDQGKCLGMYLGHKGWGEDIGGIGKQYTLSRELAPIWKMCHVGDDGNSFATCSYDRTVAIWDCSDVHNIKQIHSWQAADNAVIHLKMVGPDTIATCGSDKELKIWTLDGQLLHRVRTERGVPVGVLYLDDHLFAMAGGDSSIRIIDWRVTPWRDTPQDVLGPNGFNAHEYIISDICAAFYEDEDEKLWTKQPIMYRITPTEAGEDDACAAIDLHKQTLQEALSFEQNS